MWISLETGNVPSFNVPILTFFQRGEKSLNTVRSNLSRKRKKKKGARYFESRDEVYHPPFYKKKNSSLTLTKDEFYEFTSIYHRDEVSIKFLFPDNKFLFAYERLSPIFFYTFRSTWFIRLKKKRKKKERKKKRIPMHITRYTAENKESSFLYIIYSRVNFGKKNARKSCFFSA